MDSSNIERISKALANETRLLIFEVISRNKEITSSTIVTLCRVAAATVSHHLKILSHAGLIERRQGQFVHNRVVPRTIEVYARALCRLSRARVSGPTFLAQNYSRRCGSTGADYSANFRVHGVMCRALQNSLGTA
jgi:DNA-binding transcriptional ArsR family regulator